MQLKQSKKQAYSNKLGDVLRNLMLIAGLNERQLCKILNISTSTMNQLINQEDINPRIDTIIPIAEYFNVTIDQLIGKDPIMQNDAVARTIESSSTELFNNEWNAQLFLECADIACQLLKKYNHTLDAKKIIDIIRDFYFFSINRKGKKLDKVFIKWLIEEAME